MMVNSRTIKLPCNYELYQFDQLKSTNELVKNSPINFIKRGKYSVILANSQYRGYGRGSNIWASPKGNLYMTIAFEKAQRRYDLFQYPFLIAVILGEILAEYNSRFNNNNISNINNMINIDNVHRVNSKNSNNINNTDFHYYDYQYKWPNDILINKKKVAGILIEYDQTNIIIGIGLNLKVAPLNNSTCLQDCLKEGAKKAYNDNNYIVLPTLEKIVEAITVKFNDAQTTPQVFSKIKKLWEERAYLLNLKINFNHNDIIISGKFIGIADNGALKLEKINGEILTLYSGSICFPYSAET